MTTDQDIPPYPPDYALGKSFVERRQIYCPACATKLMADYGDTRQPAMGETKNDIILLSCPNCDAESSIIIDPAYLKEGGASDE